MALKGFKVTRPPIPNIMSPSGKLNAAKSEIKSLEKELSNLKEGGLGLPDGTVAIQGFFPLFDLTKKELVEEGKGVGLDALDPKSPKDQLLKDIFEILFKDLL